MKEIAGYLLSYARNLDKKIFLFTTIYTGFFVWINYQMRLEHALVHTGSRLQSFAGFALLYVLILGGAYLINHRAGLLVNLRDRNVSAILHHQDQPSPGRGFFWLLIIIAPVLYAWRMSSGLVVEQLSLFQRESISRYAVIILNAPLKCVVILIALCFIKRFGQYITPITGLSYSRLNLKPFLLALTIFIPVIFFAGSHESFRLAYPRAAKVDYTSALPSLPWLGAILFEISYAFDFLLVEVFFRGFLILAFIRYAGAGSILPMAAFYCAIHFGKPLPECISSYFGGILLGVITYNSGSIWGGLVLHLGIGWLMEAAGFYWNNAG